MLSGGRGEGASRCTQIGGSRVRVGRNLSKMTKGIKSECGQYGDGGEKP